MAASMEFAILVLFWMLTASSSSALSPQCGQGFTVELCRHLCDRGNLPVQPEGCKPCVRCPLPRVRGRSFEGYSKVGCTDDTGRERSLYEIWYDNEQFPCRTYTCTRNGIKVEDLSVSCPQEPSGQDCEKSRVDGQCCYNFTCTDQDRRDCIDSEGVVRSHGSTWRDDDLYPCKVYNCDDGTVEVIFDLRDTCSSPPAGGNCERFRELGQCCFNYTCDCVYNGRQYADGVTFDDDLLHPCKLLRCDQGVVITLREESCDPVTCQNPSWPLGQCCRECDSTCIFEGQTYSEGDLFYDDETRPCTLYRCAPQGRVELVNTTTCSPSPHPSCSPWLMDGICCTKWDCLEEPCFYRGQFYDDGVTFPDDTERPCRWYRCNNSEVTQHSTQLPCPPPPAPHCISRFVLGQCCPNYDCRNITCTYKDQDYELGETWYDDPNFPCRLYNCTKYGPEKLVDRTETCPPLDPRDCETEPREIGECCFFCKNPTDPTINCKDTAGNIHPEGEIYYYDPTECLLVQCVKSNEQLVFNRSDNCPARPDNPNCVRNPDSADKCCAEYICPPCVHEGVSYPTGQKFWEDNERQCRRFMCMEDGSISTVLDLLPCPQVRPDCLPNYQTPDCCHYKYTCMYDPQHNIIPMPLP